MTLGNSNISSWSRQGTSRGAWKAAARGVGGKPEGCGGGEAQGRMGPSGGRGQLC